MRRAAERNVQLWRRQLAQPIGLRAPLVGRRFDNRELGEWPETHPMRLSSWALFP